MPEGAYQWTKKDTLIRGCIMFRARKLWVKGNHNAIVELTDFSINRDRSFTSQL